MPIEFPVRATVAEDVRFMLIYCIGLPLLYLFCIKTVLHIPVHILMPLIDAYLPPQLRQILAAGIGLAWGAAVAWEYTKVSTCEPMGPETRAQFEDSQSGGMVLAVAFSAVVIVCGQLFSWAWWFLPAWTLVCIVIGCVHFRDIVDAIRHWLGYNTQGLSFVGLYQSDFGPQGFRWFLYLGTITALFLLTLPDMVKSFTAVYFFSPSLYPTLILGYTAVPLLAFTATACRKFREEQAEMRSSERVNEVIRELRQLEEKKENRFFIGRVDSDGAPVMLDDPLLDENICIEGPAGSNKTSMGLLPLIEHTILSGDDE